MNLVCSQPISPSLKSTIVDPNFFCQGLDGLNHYVERKRPHEQADVSSWLVCREMLARVLA